MLKKFQDRIRDLKRQWNKISTKMKCRDTFYFANIQPNAPAVGLQQHVELLGGNSNEVSKNLRKVNVPIWVDKPVSHNL